MKFFPDFYELNNRTKDLSRDGLVAELWRKENECNHARRYLKIIFETAPEGSLEKRVALTYLEEFDPEILKIKKIGGSV